jgi:isochorismate synthase
MSQTELIKYLLNAGLPFAAFRLPGKRQEVQVVAQKDDNVAIIDIEKIQENQGFIIAPFESTVTGKAYCIRPDIYINNSKPGGRPYKIDAEKKEDTFRVTNFETTQDEYLSRVEYLVDYLKNSTLKKIVFSRMINLPPFPDLEPVDLFYALIEKYPEAFVYLFKMPGTGAWTGATPETLFHLEDETATTVALAGTRPTDDITWTDKEITEQRIVRDFIHNILAENSIDKFTERGPVTIIAGTIVHLKTIFQMPAASVEGKEGTLINALHPTPAVCGLPKIPAYELIEKLEKHDRRFYTGFLGPWQLYDQKHLFVNLRCAEMGPTGMNIYVGGGITKDSDPEKEWEETVRKSQILLSVVEKL